MNQVSLLSIALTLFLVANPVGNSPTLVSLVKDFEFSRQRIIMLRESIVSLIIALFFQFFGEPFLEMLQIKDYALTLTGGILLFLTALTMLFPKTDKGATTTIKKEPFIVPIATPLITGPAVMALIMLFSRDNPTWIITSAIVTAWVGITAVLCLSPYMLKIFGKRGMEALAQVMGMILGLIALQMLVNGLLKFVHSLNLT